MASITSVISLFVLLLATYCYSIPIQEKIGSTTPDYKFTTGKTIVVNADKITMKLVSDDESTGVPNIHKPRAMGYKDSAEVTTPDNLKRVTHSPRELEARAMDSKESAEVTTPYNRENVSRSPREFEARAMDSKESAEVTTPDNIKRVTHSPRELILEARAMGYKDSAEVTTPYNRENVSRSPREFEVRAMDSKESAEVTTPYNRENVSRSPREFEARAMDSKESAEVTTPYYPKQVSHSPREFEARALPSDSPSTGDKHRFDKFLVSTMETSTQFERKAIRSDSAESGEQKSTPSSFPGDKFRTTTDTKPFSTSTSKDYTFTKRAQAEDDMRTTVPTSSVTSFGKMTGMLNDKDSEEKFTTPETEKSTKLSPVNTQRITKTEIIFPGKVSDLKIYGEKQPVIEKTKSDY